MPINIFQLRPQLVNAGRSIAAQQKKRQIQAQSLCRAYERISGLDDLPERLNRILQNSEKNVRCAMPSREPLSAHRSVAPPAEGSSVYIVACDGSQVSPNRHDELTFGLINAAVFAMRTNSGEAPEIVTETQLLDLTEENEISVYGVSEEIIALKRDIAERRLLAEFAIQIQTTVPIIALTDGPMELFNQTRFFSDQNQLLDSYNETLNRLADAQIIAAGYVDRPRANLVVRMTELIMDDLRQSHEVKAQFENICDVDLFSRILAPGERSAVFGLNSLSNEQTEDRLRIFFFYLNAGTEKRPYFSRIEIPGWVAANPAAIDLLHQRILEQNKALGSHPYPYALHRAHERAIVTHAEKEEIKELLIREVYQSGGRISEKSNKQIAKDASKNYL